jgi:hypothetical protein
LYLMTARSYATAASSGVSYVPRFVSFLLTKIRARNLSPFLNTPLNPVVLLHRSFLFLDGIILKLNQRKREKCKGPKSCNINTAVYVYLSASVLTNRKNSDITRFKASSRFLKHILLQCLKESIDSSRPHNDDIVILKYRWRSIHHNGLDVRKRKKEKKRGRKGENTTVKAINTTVTTIII